MIRLERLRRTYGPAVALDDVSLEVQRGEVMGLLGPNGAGKTTCLRVLTCFLPPTSGGAWIDGLDVRRDSRAIRQRLGYLPENVPLYPELRVAELLRFRGGIRGLSASELRREIDRVVEACGLGEVRRQVVGTLSRGYRQRVGLAAALLGDPPLLVLDEPTVGLDPNQMREVRELIRGLGGGHTVLLSSHLLPEVEAICSRAAIISRGRLVACAPVAELRGDRSAVLVTVRGPRERAEGCLGEVAEVERVELLAQEGETLRLRLHGPRVSEAGSRERLAGALLAAGLGLQELRQESTSLEEVFVRLTAGEEEGRA